MSKIFIDTNILFYSVDNYDKNKMEKARSVLIEIEKNKEGVISTQVIQEFYVIATKKYNKDPLIVKEIIHLFKQFEIVTVSIDIIENAIDCSILNRLSFWNSLIIVAAEKAKCEILYTDDLKHSQIIRGVKVINPFK